MDAQYRAIIFDFGGVISVNGNIHRFAKDYAKKHGMNSDEFDDFFYETWNKAKINDIPSGEFWHLIAERYGFDVLEFRNDVIEYFGFRKEMLDVIRKLKENGYKVAMLSNEIEDWLELIIEEHNLRDIFDDIITSYASGVAKPDEGIYIETFQRLGVGPEECIFVDDHRRNLAHPEHMGMKVILFHDIEQLKCRLSELGVDI